MDVVLFTYKLNGSLDHFLTQICLSLLEFRTHLTMIKQINFYLIFFLLSIGIKKFRG